MDFVRSLAPVRNEAAGRAVALLRSRVVQALPISGPMAGAADADPEPAGGDTVHAASPPQAPDRGASSERQPLEAQVRPALGPMFARAQVARVASVTSGTAPSRPAAPSALAHEQTDALVPLRSDAVGSATKPHAGADAPAASPPAPRDARAAAPRAALHRQHGDASVATPARAQPSAAHTQAPLTATTLAARAPAAAAAPTVVHVSIDRIDLRLPVSAPARPPQRSKTGSGALADYLSARKSGGSGAPR